MTKLLGESLTLIVRAQKQMIYDNDLDTLQTLQARRKGTYDKPPGPSQHPSNTKGRREGTYDKPLGLQAPTKSQEHRAVTSPSYYEHGRSRRSPKPYKHEEKGHTTSL